MPRGERARVLLPLSAPLSAPLVFLRAYRPAFVVYNRLNASSAIPGDPTASTAGGRIDRAEPPRGGSAAAAPSAAAARKRWAFRVLFELPTGEVREQLATRFVPRQAASVHASERAHACTQTTEMNCAGSLSVAQVKHDVQRQWEATQRALPAR